jgi:hypothetical protein
LLESVSSFHFSGKNGRFTASKEKVLGKYFYWRAHRTYHNRLYREHIGTSAMLSSQRLEQVAALLQTRMAESSRHSAKEGTSEREPTLSAMLSEET